MPNPAPTPEFRIPLRILPLDSLRANFPSAPRTKNADGEVFRTYGTFGRGSEQFMGIYGYFDVLPKGREEYRRGLVDWAKIHDQSEKERKAKTPCGCVPR